MTYPPPYEPQPPGAQPTQPVPSTPSSSPPTTPYPTYLGAPTPPSRPPRSNGPILAVVIALAVLLVGGTVAAGVLLVNRDNDPAVTTQPTQGTETPQEEQSATETSDPDGYSSGDPGSGQGAKVVYEVTGDGPVSLVYTGDDGISPERANDIDLPWRKELTLSDDAVLVTVTAIRSGSGKGSIECRITIDGEEVAKKKASGTLATATCTKLII